MLKTFVLINIFVENVIYFVSIFLLLKLKSFVIMYKFLQAFISDSKVLNSSVSIFSCGVSAHCLCVGVVGAQV